MSGQLLLMRTISGGLLREELFLIILTAALTQNTVRLRD
jgi:hypothetical protein